MTVQDSFTPVYRYYTANLITGKIVMEIPFQGVSWERKVSAAGTFSGSIAADTSSDIFDLYESTIPGKYGLYVLRDGVCVWGGIIWSREYSLTERSLQVTALEFVSYLHHRVFWKSFTTDTYEYSGDDESVAELLQILIDYVNDDQSSYDGDPFGYLASDVHARINNYERSGTTMTLTTEESHGFSNGQQIYVGGFTGVVAGIDGEYTLNSVSGVINERQFRITTSSSATVGLTTISASAPTHAIAKSTRDILISNANVRINFDHTVDTTDLNTQFTDATGDNNPFTFRGSEMRYVGEIIKNFSDNGVPTREANKDAIPKAVTALGAEYRIVRKAVTQGSGSATVTLTTATTHNFNTDDVLNIYYLDTPYGNGDVTPPITFLTATVSAVDYAKKTFSYPVTYIGAAQPDVSVISDFTRTRFDYLIESSYDPVTLTFSNTFKAWLIKKDVIVPGATESSVDLNNLYGFSGLGASQYIFEHPGNVINITMTEDADSSATRTWLVDNNNDLGANAAKYYGSYTNLPYLEAGFPILDTAITDRDLAVFSDEQVAPFAKEIGYRLAPPIGQFNVSVNGSLSPEVGTYKPGDWCVVVPNDSFIEYRLKPPYENRPNLLVRKIRSYKVQVPDFPAFPEVVELELIPEWLVE